MNDVKIPKWLEWASVPIVLGALAFFTFKTPTLEPNDRTRGLSERMASEDVAECCRAVWSVLELKPDDAVTLTHELIGLLTDETEADEETAEAYHRNMEKRAGPLSGFYVPKTIRIGDLAAHVLGCIWKNLVIETAGEGGPTTLLAAYRKAVNQKVVPMLCTGGSEVKTRILWDVLVGDTDSSPMQTVIACCLSDANAQVRAASLALFFTYVHSDRSKVLAVRPQIEALKADPDPGVRMLAGHVLDLLK